MYEKYVKNTRRMHPILFLLILFAATILTGALALEGSSSGNAASEVPNMPGLMSADQPIVGASLPQTVTNKIAFVSDRRILRHTIDIWVMNADGSSPVNLTADVSEGSNSSPTWAPDGTKIAYGYGNQGPGNGIYIMNSDGTGRARVGPEAFYGDPAWSPHGDKIAFDAAPVSPSVHENILVMNIDGSNITNLTNDNGDSLVPAWSPDGSKIAFERSAGSAFDIFVMNANGSGQIDVTNTPSVSEMNPAWSPDGSKIAYTGPGASSSEKDIWVMNANGTNQHNLTNNPNGSEDHATWSPDGTKIAYSTSTTIGVSPGEIYAMNANGSNPVNITNNASDDLQPAWSPGSLSLVQVKDEQGNSVQGAEVYRNCTLLGLTDARGVVGLPSPALSEHLIARSLVYTGTATKANHAGWAYHVWLTNLRQENDGTQTDYTITDTNKITQTVTLKKDNAQIGLNLVASVNYNATSANLADIAAGLKKASGYLLDVTDGQMFIEKSTLYEDNQNFEDADIQFAPSEWPAADVRGIVTATGHLYMPGPGFNGQTYTGSWTQPSAFRTFVHEFGHYAFGAYDEYTVITGTQGTASCTLDRNSMPEANRASIMDSQYDSTELCADNNHNPNTAQGQTLGESVWATFLRNWDDNQNRWTIRTPMSRNAVDPGPNTPSCINTPTISIIESTLAACAPISAHTVITYNGSRLDATGVGVFLSHSGRRIYEGVTNGQGKVSIYGASFGDVITATSSFSINGTLVPYAASVPVNSCGAIPLMIMRRVIVGPSAAAGTPDPPVAPNAVNVYWLTSKLNHAAGTVDLSIHFDGPTTTGPSLSLSQDGGPDQPVSLTYDPPTYTYNGSVAYDSGRALHFQASVGIATSGGSLVSTYPLEGDTFSSGGPFIGDGVQQIPRKLPPPQAWEVFEPEAMVNLAVNSTSMANGTGLLVGQTSMPPGTPPNLLAVGGPYSIEGENPITGQVGASLNFQAEYYCGLQPGSIAIYHYDSASGTWTRLTTGLNDTWNQAYAAITQWGIYAVFAQPDTVATFTDVPSGSAFHEYIEWMSCHRIASGYSDGTFRPGTNSTRGQISKMVVLANNWNQEPPSGQNYTFTDVSPGSTFFSYVETAYGMGSFSGYPCGGTGEPCDSQHRPYFRPSAKVTRGQIAKILSSSANFDEQPTGQTFSDVPTGSTFYVYVERMASRGIIGGYACGGPGEPCDSQHRPYFRPQNDATRGQLSKMIYLTVQPR